MKSLFDKDRDRSAVDSVKEGKAGWASALAVIGRLPRYRCV